MAFVKVTVIDLEGNAHEAEVDPRAHRETVARDLADELGLSPIDEYTIRYAGQIREGAVIVLDRGTSKSARLL
jgi:hypothetical protein